MAKNAGTSAEKVARPKPSGKVVSVRLADEQYAQLTAAADARYIPVKTYAKLILAGVMPPLGEKPDSQ